VIEVAEFTVTPVAAVEPNLTVAPATKFVPVMLTDVPPARGPKVGLNDVTVGAPVADAGTSLMTNRPATAVVAAVAATTVRRLEARIRANLPDVAGSRNLNPRPF
jgi:hypothetical protein